MSVDRTRSPGGIEPAAVTSSLIAALIGGVVFGVILHATGRMGSVAGLYGLDGAIAGWVLHVVHSAIAGALFAGLVSYLARGGFEIVEALEQTAGTTGTSTIVGAVYGLAVWVLVVAIATPLWMDLVMGIDRPFPYLHWLSLGGLLVFGATLGALFPPVHDYVHANVEFE